MSNLLYINKINHKLISGKELEINLSYQTFGLPLGKAPIVLVNHALTGNSNVSGDMGWWNTLINENKVIDTNKYSIIAFNIPGNGFDNIPENLIENYKDISTKDIASIFWEGLKTLKIKELFAVIGGSLGGAIAWEMAFLQPNAIENLIPIATNWKANDWLIGNVLVQDTILNNSNNPIHDARLHAMLLYRTPQSLAEKFNIEKNTNSEIYKIESWLLHHGEKLTERFQLSSYKLMNNLLKTIGKNLTENNLIQFAKNSNTKINQVSVDTDYFFTPDENQKTQKTIHSVSKNIISHEIKSIHGHDAFLLEYECLNSILRTIF